MSMRSAGRPEEVNWDAVIGRALCQLALSKRDDLLDAGLPARAAFLVGLGLPKADVALLLGSTEGSVKEALGRSRKPRKKNANKKR
jgi:hypothetical protein